MDRNELINAYLQAVETYCPGCSEPVSFVVDERCPRCGEHIELTVRARPRFHYSWRSGLWYGGVPVGGIFVGGFFLGLAIPAILLKIAGMY